MACAALWAVGWSGQPPPLAADSFDPERADFTIAYNNEVSSFRAAAAVVLPGATMTLQVTGGPAGEYTMTTKTGAVNPYAPRKWRWHAPAEPGMYDLRFEGSKARDAIHLHVFVMVPASAVRDGMLNGYRIGQYPDQAPERVGGLSCAGGIHRGDESRTRTPGSRRISG